MAAGIIDLPQEIPSITSANHTVSCSYSIDALKGVIFLRASGVLTDKSLQTALVAMASDKDFHPDYRGFSDNTEVTEHLVAAVTLQLLANNPRSSAASRWAFLVNEGLATGIARFYKSCLKYGHLEVFTNRAEALAWLNEGVPPEKVIT